MYVPINLPLQYWHIYAHAVMVIEMLVHVGVVLKYRIY